MAMVVYTVLGGTGSTGSAIIRNLAGSPHSDCMYRIFVRSKPKTLALLPDLDTLSDMEIIDGSLTDQATLVTCLSESSAIFSCIATNDSAPDTSIALDTAVAIIAALKHVKDVKGKDYVKPVGLMLSSASLDNSLDDKPPPIITKNRCSTPQQTDKKQKPSSNTSRR